VTPDTEGAIQLLLTDEQALALTMDAEGTGDWREGGSSAEERIAIGTVVRNRVHATPGTTFRAVCLARKQFSCWNPGTDANHVRLMKTAQAVVGAAALLSADLAETFYLARGIIDGVIQDRTNGATHYYAPNAMKPAGSKPFWVYLNGKNGPEHPAVAVIGSQRFYKGV